MVQNIYFYLTKVPIIIIKMLIQNYFYTSINSFKKFIIYQFKISKFIINYLNNKNYQYFLYLNYHHLINFNLFLYNILYNHSHITIKNHIINHVNNNLNIYILMNNNLLINMNNHMDIIIFLYNNNKNLFLIFIVFLINLYHFNL